MTSGRTLTEKERAQLRRALEVASLSEHFATRRTAAFVLLLWGSALRASEAVALNVDHVLEDVSGPKLGRMRASTYLDGGRAGLVVITREARAALRLYLLERQRRGWLELPSSGALFVTEKGGGRPGAPSRERLSKRAAEHAWQRLRDALDVAEALTLQDLRADALTRIGHHSGGNVRAVQQFGRLNDVRTAQAYVPAQPVTLAQLGSMASARRR